MWSTFEMKNLGDYLDLYVQGDIFLGDIFENFKETCLNT